MDLASNELKGLICHKTKANQTWLSGKENIPVAAVSKDGYVDLCLGHERTYHNWFPWKRWNCKQCFPTANSLDNISPYLLGDHHTYIIWGLVDWVLWYINLCRLFNAKSSLYIYIKYIWFGLVGFYGISTIVGYLMPNPLYTYILNIYDLVGLGFMAYQSL